MKTITVVVCEPGKEARVEEIDSSLSGMQKVVDGYIETYYPFDDDVCIVCNEEGKMNGSRPCRAVFDDDGEIVDIIFGTFFVCGCGKEFLSSLTNQQLAKYTKRFSSPEAFYRDVDGKLHAKPVF